MASLALLEAIWHPSEVRSFSVMGCSKRHGYLLYRYLTYELAGSAVMLEDGDL